MLLFGQEAPYLPHLPMFEKPRNFQVSFDVDINVDISDAVLEALRADREAGGDGAPARTSIVGTVLHCHFERGGGPITGQVTALARVVVYVNAIDPSGDATRNSVRPVGRHAHNQWWQGYQGRQSTTLAPRLAGWEHRHAKSSVGHAEVPRTLPSARQAAAGSHRGCRALYLFEV